MSIAMSATSNSALGNALFFVGKPATDLPTAAAVSNAADGKSNFRVSAPTTTFTTSKSANEVSNSGAGFPHLRVGKCN